MRGHNNDVTEPRARPTATAAAAAAQTQAFLITVATEVWIGLREVATGASDEPERRWGNVSEGSSCCSGMAL